jgi:hypothetical protein
MIRSGARVEILEVEMALLSPKNFVTPFTNKVHLASIAFVVILFAAFRAMGGAFSVQTISSSPGARGGLGIGREVAAPRAPINLDEGTSNQDILGDTGAGYDDVDSELSRVPEEAASDRNAASRGAAGNDLDELIKKLNSR